MLNRANVNGGDDDGRVIGFFDMSICVLRYFVPGSPSFSVLPGIGSCGGWDSLYTVQV